jgi:hypothetical protein
MGLVCFLLTIAVAAAPGRGQVPANEQPAGVTPTPPNPPADQAPADEPQEVDFSRMPAPVSQITGNLLELEKTGYFKIIRARHGRTKMFDDQAMIWTVEVIKPLTCGHALLLLKHFSDIRFYQDEEDYERLVFSTRLFYEAWLDSGAVSHEILDQDERFDIWMDLTEAEAWNLNHEKANKVVFGELGQHHRVRQDFFKWK